MLPSPASGKRVGRDHQVQQVQHVLENNGVVHRAALEVATIGKNLLRQLAVEKAQARMEPAFGFGTGEEQAGVDQRLGVGEQVVAQQMALQAAGEITNLDRQTVEPSRFQGIARPRPLNPVDDAQRQRVRLPAVAMTRRIVGDPAGDQGALPVPAFRRAFCVEVVEVMQVVQPEFVPVRPVPVGG